MHQTSASHCPYISTLTTRMLLTGNAGAESIKADIDILITSVYLINIADDACALGRHRSYQKCDSGTDVR